MARQTRFPTKFQDADFSNLKPWQFRVLADWMGCRIRLERQFHGPNKSGALNGLKEICLADPVRAQQGYDVVVLLKKSEQSSNSNAATDELVSSLYGTVSSIIKDHEEALGGKAAVAVAEEVSKVVKGLEKFAKEAIVKEAIVKEAKARAPLVIKQGAKTRTVKGVLPPEFERMVQLASARASPSCS